MKWRRLFYVLGCFFSFNSIFLDKVVSEDLGDGKVLLYYECKFWMRVYEKYRMRR